MRTALLNRKIEAQEIFKQAKDSFIGPMDLRQYDAFSRHGVIVGTRKYSVKKSAKARADYETAKLMMMDAVNQYRNFMNMVQS